MQWNWPERGLPEWSEADEALARGLQRELGVAENGLATELGEMGGPTPEPRLGGFSDDIGDISWKVPTVPMRFPSNIPGGPGHHWANAVAMATPIAHKGAAAGRAGDRHDPHGPVPEPGPRPGGGGSTSRGRRRNTSNTPLLSDDDLPAIHLNKEKMDSFREAMRPFYYDPERYDTYLEQLGIEYPTVREGGTGEVRPEVVQLGWCGPQGPPAFRPASPRGVCSGHAHVPMGEGGRSTNAVVLNRHGM